MSTNTFKPETPADAFSRAVVARLSQTTETLPHDITERLRAARMQALSKRKVEVVQIAPAWSMQGGAAALQLGGDESGFWRKLAAVVPLIALIAGLVSIGWIQDEMRANELAQVDAELLIDELPPAAYVDPGFVQFLRTNRVNQ